MRRLLNLLLNLIRIVTNNFWAFVGSLIKLVILFILVLIIAPLFFCLYNIPFTGFEVDFWLTYLDKYSLILIRRLRV